MPCLRSQQRRAIFQPAEEPAQRRTLHEHNPRQIRVSSDPGDAHVTRYLPQLNDISEWEESIAERARPSWADADPIRLKENKYLWTMKPIGQYPSPAEYKSLATREVLDDPITGMPITPVAEEAATGAPANGQLMTRIEKMGVLNGSIECIVGETIGAPIEDTILSEDIDGDALTTNLATPVSETLEKSTVHPSFSPAESPLDTPVDELLTDSVITHLNAPGADTPLHQPQSPPATAVTDGRAPKKRTAVTRDFVAMLKSLPDPKSRRYDVQQLKRVVELAISHSAKRGEDEVALSLVYYWSGISNDDFKLSLIHNIGRDDADHSLQLALKTMLRHSIDDASKWYGSLSADRARALTHENSESELSSAQSFEAEPTGRTPFKTADIYRDTSGPKLEEAFVSGKTNTAPLKRPKKPCPINETSFKRRREWEADPTLGENLQKKRARFSQTMPAENDEAAPKSSSLRPKRGEEINIMQPYTMGGRARNRRNSLASRSSATDAAEDSSSTPDVRGVINERQKRHQPAKRPQRANEELGVDPNQAVDSDVSNSVYSVCVNDWTADYPPRLMPDQVEPPENSDNCYKCDRGGNLLCCDTCSNAFHFRCVRPAMDPKNPPKGEWHCMSCVVRNCATEMIRRAHDETKTEFRPPTDIKDYFAGVGERVQYDSGHLGEQRYYETVPHLPRLTKAPKQAGVPAYNDPNLLRLMENGQVILCTRCGLSSENVRPIIRCDYCPSRFHLDCLDPPRANPPDPSKGWMCPNHVRSDEMIVSKMVEGRLQERRVRRPKNCVAVDVDILTTDDPRETTFDEDWREKRARLPAGDIVLDFVGVVREKKQQREREYFDNVAKTAITIARQLTKEHLSSMSASSDAGELPVELEHQIKNAIESMRTGTVPEEQFDAAATFSASIMEARLLFPRSASPLLFRLRKHSPPPSMMSLLPKKKLRLLSQMLLLIFRSVTKSPPPPLPMPRLDLARMKPLPWLLAINLFLDPHASRSPPRPLLGHLELPSLAFPMENFFLGPGRLR
ncbi:uncharacterized protein N7477_003595 [Penicillium maclennaniae]|uniref:uncharacterized protein n=1 Tax=Penicillium maclennaniae TaxID=1343394 RepID=UPI002540E52F|nr:uncharacterized protein N7477_003595 [Penicillium maclennaniae]KAJ5677962.1 hypothetical protein N7477_003595 [Penicillium maclennaniae]